MSNRSTRRQVLAAAAGVGIGMMSRGARATAVRSAGESPLAGLDAMLAKFMEEHKPPGASVAVSYHGRLVYARGFGLADVEKKEPVQVDSLFRLASISKPFTSAAVMRLVQAGKLKLDDKVFPLLKLEPLLKDGDTLDPRWHDITVQQCLQHTGGWDRSKGFDPMGARAAEMTAEALNVPLPITATQIIRFTMGKPLNSDPGTAYAYSNFGYCVLGRVIENVSGVGYEEFVKREVLAPLHITDMRLGKNLLVDRAPHEVKYYDSGNRTGRAISGPHIGEAAPVQYGVECLETMDANGGWIASATDLMRFAVALENPEKCPILKPETVATMLTPPPGPVGHESDGRPKRTYYACGWSVRRTGRGRIEKNHAGLLAGSSTMLVCGDDGVNWAALFNCDADKDGKEFAGLIRQPMSQTLAEVQEWPKEDLFGK